MTFRAYPTQPVEGEVTLIYPELRAETRTARVRIQVANPDSRLKVDMYADVVFHTGAEDTPVVAVPASAVIDSGTRQVVLVAKGEGRFEPSAVKTGRRGDGFVEITRRREQGRRGRRRRHLPHRCREQSQGALCERSRQEPPK